MQGFTRTPQVRAILDKYEHQGSDLVNFEGLTTEDAEQLIEVLPEDATSYYWNSAPSFRDMVELGKKYPGTLFHGYRITEEREDERITVEGFYLPIRHIAEFIQNCEFDEYEPNEWGEITYNNRVYVRSWWD